MKDRLESTSMISQLAREDDIDAFQRKAYILGRSTKWLLILRYKPLYMVIMGSTMYSPRGYELAIAIRALLSINFCIFALYYINVITLIQIQELCIADSLFYWIILYIKQLQLTMYLNGSRAKDVKPMSKYKYSFNSNIYDLNVSSSFENKIGVTRAKQLPGALTLPEKIKSHASFSVDRITKFQEDTPKKGTPIIGKKTQKVQKDVKTKDKFKLPQIKKLLNLSNPQDDQKKLKRIPEQYYQAKVFRGYKNRQNTYMMNLARQHFLQSVQAIKIGRNIKLGAPKEIKLSKRNPKHKTIFLDLDETLIHCDQTSTSYTVKLNFPIEGGGGTIAAGIRVRPFCHQFIKQLSSFAEVIIFTASAPSYADVVLDYLDPHHKFFSHRLYRHHCTLQKGFYTKDLRIVNRRPEDVAIVDNSAFSFMTQPQFGIPVLPFYHFAKDKELNSLLQFLKRLVQQADMRQKIKQTFFWHIYRKSEEDPRKLFQQYFQQAGNNSV